MEGQRNKSCTEKRERDEPKKEKETEIEGRTQIREAGREKRKLCEGLAKRERKRRRETETERGRKQVTAKIKAGEEEDESVRQKHFQ